MAIDLEVVLGTHLDLPSSFYEALRSNRENVYYNRLLIDTLKHIRGIQFSCGTMRSVERLVKAINSNELSGRSTTASVYLAAYELASWMTNNGRSDAWLYIIEADVAPELMSLLEALINSLKEDSA